MAKSRLGSARAQGPKISRSSQVKASRKSPTPLATKPRRSQHQTAPKQDSLYNYPHYYDILFADDQAEEIAFLERAFTHFCDFPVREVFEPACGTGRILDQLARKGYVPHGLDLNPKAVAYCNQRFSRRGLPPPAWVGDMTQFTLPRPVDAGFNTINSFRHLLTEELARAHLEAMAAAIRPGGIYLLGLHLLPTQVPPLASETWRAARGRTKVVSRLKTQVLDRRARHEICAITLDVEMPTRKLQLRDQLHFRTYTWPQFKKLLAGVPAWQVAATFDFGYDIDHPIRPSGSTQDILFVLKRLP